MSDEPLDSDPGPDPGPGPAVDDEDEDQDGPWIVSTCPVGPELAAQIAGMLDVDWKDFDAGEQAMAAAGWRSTGDYLGELDNKAHTPAGHFVYGDDCLAIPFAYEFYVHPDGAIAEDFWATVPGWQSLPDPPAGTFDAQLESAVDRFTTILGPPDHDLTHERRPALDRRWRYRIWRRGGNVLVVAPGLDDFSYSQFEHAFVQIRPLPANAPLPPTTELPDFFW
ncbi:hypothetical protein ACIRVF_10690 [Kitasatospora sp. NPDC101157]|uniref:hypothetical protein n=1 Tax=Kitasatospora sp. NPDC101157 TaxID=3364098 RepID=UPI00381FAD64